MLNEHVYCPRLFHLEWVGGQFVDNDYTVDGRWQHRAVDAERGAAPGPEFQDQWREATSVSLSSERLGLIGKADVIHGTGASVVPVDVKRGRPAPTADRIWPPERMQIIALAHLLRDNGYACDQAAIFFVETRTKVTINVGPETEAVLLEAVDSLRQTARSLDPPPPLVDS
ncbi:MAG: Dna2/Cas4 domain-containing protein, partial [Microthrixaceae bacterium]